MIETRPLDQLLVIVRDMPLDPASIDKNEIYSSLMILQHTQRLDTTAECRRANAFVASLYQLVMFKEAAANTVYNKAEEALEAEKNRKAYSISTGYAAQSVKKTKGEIDLEVVNSEEVKSALAAFSTAYKIKQFWTHISQMLEFVAKRIDSAMMSIGVDAKLN
jgi:hypothetical protein